jgi:hypothetical protein
MPAAAEFFRRYRVAVVALAASAALHAAVFVGFPASIEGIAEKSGLAYSASLDPAADLTATDVPAPAAPRRVAKTPAKPRMAPAPEVVPEPMQPQPDVVASAPEPKAPEQAPDPPPEEPMPEVVAMAKPPAPPPAPQPAPFPVEAFPASVSISYALTSAFAEGRAEYTWSREGDSYRITGEAEATGFFTLFLEGRILQESRGTVSPEGLRPERFSERKPNLAIEGLEFDWASHKVTFDRNGSRSTVDLGDNTVDWLSMIFHLAHVPPAGENYELRVYTQRKLYDFKLKVLGVEDIEIPLGKVKALHLRHVSPKDGEAVDVWLGVDHHYLPVKLRYPVARNRLVVEQAATSIAAR